MAKKLFKVRMNCISFHDVIVKASSKKKARELAENDGSCPQADMEFVELLPVEDWDNDKREYDE